MHATESIQAFNNGDKEVKLL